MLTAETFRRPGTNRIDFPSVAALAAVHREDSLIAGLASRLDRKGWTGESLAEALSYAEAGNTQCVPAAEALLERIEREADLATLRPEWQASVAGAFPSVPDFLAGNPECMRRKVAASNESTPITVWVCTTSSGGVSHEAMRNRGIAVLALAMALSNVRPVEIRIFTAHNGDRRGDSVITCKLTSPLCLSEAAWALTSCSIDRSLAWGVGLAYTGFDGHNWADGIVGSSHDAKGQAEVCRAMLGACPEDIVIPPTTLGTAKKFSDPVAWVIERLKEFKAREE